MDNVNISLDDQSKKRIYLANESNPYCDVLPFELKYSFPKVNYTGFFAQKNEAIIYAVPAFSFTEKVKTTGYSGKSAGVSVRVAKGLTVRTGGSGGNLIRQNIKEEFRGDYIITNKRIIFVSEKEGFEYKLNQITAVKLIDSESFYIQSGKTIKNIRVNGSNLAYTYSLTNTAIDNFIKDVDIYPDLNVTLNEEQENYMSRTRREINEFINKTKEPIYSKRTYSSNEYNNSKRNRNGKPKINLTKKQMFIIGFVIFCLIVYFVDKFTDKEKNFDASDDNLDRINLEVSNYATADVHPRIFDDIDSVREFYSDKGDNVVITDGRRLGTQYKAGLGNGLKYKKSTLFFVEDASNKNSLGYIEFYLKDSKSKKYSLDECIKIAVDFLPKNFFELYKFDVSYIQKGDIATYVYAVRLNEKGREYMNNVNRRYSPYYSIYISTDAINSETTNHNWKISTDFSAYGDWDLGWIKKNTEPWNINLQDYVK